MSPRLVRSGEDLSLCGLLHAPLTRPVSMQTDRQQQMHMSPLTQKCTCSNLPCTPHPLLTAPPPAPSPACTATLRRIFRQIMLQEKARRANFFLCKDIGESSHSEPSQQWEDGLGWHCVHKHNIPSNSFPLLTALTAALGRREGRAC